MSAMEQSVPDAEVNKVYNNYIEAFSSAMVDQEKIQALKEFLLAEVSLYHFFGEVQNSKNSRATVLVSECTSPTFIVLLC